MGQIVRVALVVASLFAAHSARADEADLCRSLTAAWKAARADPASMKEMRFAGADRCSFSDNDLRCFWRFASPEEAHRTYEGFEAVATACFAPLGLSAVHKVLHGVETTSLEPRDDRDPNVDLFYPPGSPIVGISIVTAD